MFVLNDIRYKNILYIDKLTIPKERITCFLGESGSGKTTALRLLNNLISGDSGDIYFKGKKINEYSAVELRRKVMMLPQIPVVFEGTIKNNLITALMFSEKPEFEDKKLKEMLNYVFLEKNLECNAQELSGGEKQRMALARVILLDPDVFLLDEPSSALDQETEIKVMENLFKLIKDRKKTAVLVTHNIKIAEKFGDYIVKFNAGKIIGIERMTK